MIVSSHAIYIFPREHLEIVIYFARLENSNGEAHPRRGAAECQPLVGWQITSGTILRRHSPPWSSTFKVPRWGFVQTSRSVGSNV